MIVGTLCSLMAFTSGILFLQTTSLNKTPVHHMIDPILHDRLLFESRNTEKYSVLSFTEFDRDTNFSSPVREEDVHNFSQPVFMIGNNSICDDNVEILVYIQSAWENFLKRRLLRRTWASSKVVRDKRVKAFFILGRPKFVNDQVRINNEQLLHGDIVEGDFVDSYQNISIKSIIALSWASKFCRHVKYVIKSDDDIFVNLYAIADKILPLMSHESTSIACHVVKEGTSPIVRDPKSKWYIPPNIFPNMTHFPRFCSGYLVVMTAKTVSALLSRSKYYPLLQVDDIYVFGQLTQNMNVDFINIRHNLTLSDAEGVKSYKEHEGRYLGIGVGGTSAMEELWALTLSERNKMTP